MSSLNSNPLAYLNSKVQSALQFVVPSERGADAMVASGSSSFFWQKDIKSANQQFLIIPIGDPDSNTYVISFGPYLLKWAGGVAEPKSIVVAIPSKFTDPEFSWEIYWVKGEGENCLYHIVHKQTGDYLARIGCNIAFQPDLRCATLWAADGAADQLFAIENATKITVPDLGRDTVHPITYIEKECQIKSWEAKVPLEIPEVIVAEILVPYIFLDGDKSLRYSKGPYYKLQRTLSAVQRKPMTKIDGDSPFTLRFGEEVSQASHSITEIMQSLKIGASGGAEVGGGSLALQIQAELRITKTDGSSLTSGSSSSSERSWPVGSKVRIAYWLLTEKFSLYDATGHMIGDPYSTTYKEVTVWDEN